MAAQVARYLFGSELQIRCTKCRGAYWCMDEFRYYRSPLVIDYCARCATHQQLGTVIIDIFAKRRYTR